MILNFPFDAISQTLSTGLFFNILEIEAIIVNQITPTSDYNKCLHQKQSMLTFSSNFRLSSFLSRLVIGYIRFRFVRVTNGPSPKSTTKSKLKWKLRAKLELPVQLLQLARVEIN